MILTQPTKLTQQEYENCFIAINPANGEHWLMLPDGDHIFVAKDMRSTEASNPAINPDCYEEEVQVTDEVGCKEWINAWCCKTTKCLNQIDLELLAEGKVEWV